MRLRKMECGERPRGLKPLPFEAEVEAASQSSGVLQLGWSGVRRNFLAAYSRLLVDPQLSCLLILVAVS